jgi:myosin heavy subunit
VAQRTSRQVRQSGDQSIIIGGESGAGMNKITFTQSKGKTESTKIILRYLTHIGQSMDKAHGVPHIVEQRILDANIILGTMDALILLIFKKALATPKQLGTITLLALESF